MPKTALEIARERELSWDLRDKDKNAIIDLWKEKGIEWAKDFLNTTVEQPKQDFSVEPWLFWEQETVKIPEPIKQLPATDLAPNQALPKIGQPFESIDPKTGQKFKADGTEYIEPLQTSDKTPKTTGIEKVDTALDELRWEKQEDIDTTLDSYNIARGNIQKQKDNYLNFDSVNEQFEGVMSDLRAFGDAEITEEQYQAIATKYGVSIDQVKNPTAVFENLEFSEEWRKQPWADRVDRKLYDAETQFERNKQDLETQLERTKQSLTQQIEDTAVQVGRNIAYAEASGTWSGGLRSSWFKQGIQNMQEDGDKTISRLDNAIQTAESQNETTVKRLTDDYATAVTRTKQDLDSTLKDLKTDNSLQLSKAIQEYGVGTDGLTDALNAIDEEFGTASLDVFNKYLTNMRSIQDITNTNLETYQKSKEIEDARINKRYNELLDNDWVVLLNSSLNSLAKQVESGEITTTRYNDLKRIMQSSITSTLWEYATDNNQAINQADLNTIDALLNQGKTPTEVVASMQENEKFMPKEEVTVKTQIDLWDRKKIIYSDGTSEIISKWATPSQSRVVSPWDVIQNTDGSFTTVPKESDFQINQYFDSNNVSWYIKQVFWTPSPLSIDNVLLPNWKTWTPWIDIAWTSWSEIKPFTDWKIVKVIKWKQRGDAGYGNQVIVENNWAWHVYSHLWDVNVSEWQTVWKDTIIGTMWNTGSTVWPTGTHLDYRVTLNKDIQPKSGDWVDPSQFMWQEVEITASDISSFNNSTFKPQNIDDPETQKKYDIYLKNQDKIFSDMNADFYDVIEASIWWGAGSTAERDTLSKYTQALWGLEQLSDNLWGQSTGKIVWKLKKLDPFNPDVAEFKAIVAWLVPTVARGVFNEVWVLTEADIKNYLGTLPNIENTDEQNKLITSSLLKTLSQGMKSQLGAMSRSWLDVSRYEGQIRSIDDRISNLNTQLWISTWNTTENDTIDTEDTDALFDSYYE